MSSSLLARTQPSLSSGARHVDSCGDGGGVGSIMGEPKSIEYFVRGGDQIGGREVDSRYIMGSSRNGFVKRLMEKDSLQKKTTMTPRVAGPNNSWDPAVMYKRFCPEREE